MKSVGDSHLFVLPPPLLAKMEAVAKEEHRSADDLVNELIEQGLGQRRLRAEILARVDEAEAPVARGEGIVITDVSIRQLAVDVKHRGRTRLAAENTIPR